MPQIRGQIGQVSQIQVQSYILDCFWGLPEVAVGGIVSIEVRTAYVSDQADIKITIKDTSGSVHSSLGGKVLGNYFRAQFRVPTNSSSELFFEAELAAHKLKRLSPKVTVWPALNFSNHKWANPQDGNALTELKTGTPCILEVQVKGLPEGKEGWVRLFSKVNGSEKNELVQTFKAKTEKGKVLHHWDGVLELTGKSKISELTFSVIFLGSESVASGILKYNSLPEFTFSD